MDGLVHDIRNLISVIRGNLEMIGISTGPGAQGKKNLMQALRALDRLESLVAEKKRGALLDINREVKEAGDAFSVMAAKRGINLDCGLDKGRRSVERLEIDKFRRTLFNILLNAVEAAKSQILIRAETWFEPLDASSRHVISVLDDGPGIDSGKLPLVFQAGFSGKGSHRGHGLHVVREMASHFDRIAVHTSSARTGFHIVFKSGIFSGRKELVQGVKKCG